MSKAVWHRDANRWGGSPSAARCTFTGFVTLIHRIPPVITVLRELA